MKSNQHQMYLGLIECRMWETQFEDFKLERRLVSVTDFINIRLKYSSPW